MERLSDSMRKIILAGIGAVATSAEKSKDVLDELVKKGELTVEQGKVLNEELKHNVKKTVKGEKEEKDAADILKNLSPEQIAALREQLAKMDEETVEEEASGEA